MISSPRRLLAILLIAVFAPTGSPGEPGLNTLPKWGGSNLAGTGAEPMPYIAIPRFEKIPWRNPLCMVPVPNDPAERYLVLERFGSIWLLDTENESRKLFLPLAGTTPQTTRGRPNIHALGAAFHPEFPKQPFVFIGWNERLEGGSTNRLTRFRVETKGTLKADPESGEHLLEWDSSGHNGTDIHFGSDGYLYMTSGDGGAPGDPRNIGQKTDNLLGSILRIDVDRRDGSTPYSIPKDNPFVGVSGVRPEVFAYGLRNPWRMCFRPGTDEIWLGDNGDEHWEMADRILPGANYGWSAYEGSHPFRTTNQLEGPTKVLTLPVVEHPHTEMRSVIGGFWYRGNKLPELRGTYLYGCYLTRKLWGFAMDGDKPRPPARLTDTGGQIVSFAESPDNEVFIVTLDRGIMQLEKAPPMEKPEPIPHLLSETGLFEDTKSHSVAKGIFPYDVKGPVFWNGAQRERFIAVPDGGKIEVIRRPPPGMTEFNPSVLRSAASLDRWLMPRGSIVFQTFFLGDGDSKLRVETQISFKDGGEWRFLTYRWNDDQTDAELVPEEGESAVIIHLEPSPPHRLTDQEWRFPSRAECATCHTQRSLFVTGINIGQLNREFDYSPLGGKVANQLLTFHKLGLLQGNFKMPSPETMPALPDPNDASRSLDERARSYLHVNCAHCHRETGVGGRANFQLLHWLHTKDLGITGVRPLVGLPGIDPAEGKLIAPGDPHHSELYRRMVTEDTGKMPLLGGDKIDKVGADLIRRWIEAMPKGTTP